MRPSVVILSVMSMLASPFYAWSLLSYDFSDPAQLDDWEVANDAGGQWTIKDGVLEYVNPSARWDVLVPKDVVFTDGVIEVKMNWIEGTWCEGGVAYRIQEDGIASYNVHLSLSGNELRWCVWTAPDVLARITRPIVDGWPEAERWFKIRVEVNGDNQKIYVDDELIDEQDDDTFESGRAGLMGYSAVQEVILYDDFVLDGPGIRNNVAVKPQTKLATAWGEVKVQY